MSGEQGVALRTIATFSSWDLLQEIGDQSRIAVEVIQVVLENAIDGGVVYPGIVMDDDIAETSHVQQARQKILRKDTLFLQDNKDILVVLGVTEAKLGDQMTANIQTDLHTHLQCAFDVAT